MNIIITANNLELFFLFIPSSFGGMFSVTLPRSFVEDPDTTLYSRKRYRLELLSSKATSLSLRNSLVPTGSNTLASIRAWQSRVALSRDTSLVQNTTFCIK